MKRVELSRGYQNGIELIQTVIINNNHKDGNSNEE